MVSVVKMATVFEGYTTKEQRSVVRVLWEKGLLSAKDFVKKRSLFTVGSVCSVKRFSLGGKRYADEVETEVQKWLRQQAKDFYAVGFDAVVKRWNESINVGGDYVEK
jgi:hypothetical protein